MTFGPSAFVVGQALGSAEVSSASSWIPMSRWRSGGGVVGAVGVVAVELVAVVAAGGGGGGAGVPVCVGVVPVLWVGVVGCVSVGWVSVGSLSVGWVPVGSLVDTGTVVVWVTVTCVGAALVLEPPPPPPPQPAASSARPSAATGSVTVGGVRIGRWFPSVGRGRGGTRRGGRSLRRNPRRGAAPQSQAGVVACGYSSSSRASTSREGASAGKRRRAAFRKLRLYSRAVASSRVEA